MCRVNDSPQGPSLRHSRRVPLVLTVRSQFSNWEDEPSNDLIRLLLYRLEVLEAAMQRVRELSIAACAPISRSQEKSSAWRSALLNVHKAE